MGIRAPWFYCAHTIFFFFFTFLLIIYNLCVIGEDFLYFSRCNFICVLTVCYSYMLFIERWYVRNNNNNNNNNNNINNNSNNYYYYYYSAVCFQKNRKSDTGEQEEQLTYCTVMNTSPRTGKQGGKMQPWHRSITKTLRIWSLESRLTKNV